MPDSPPLQQGASEPIRELTGKCIYLYHPPPPSPIQKKQNKTKKQEYSLESKLIVTSLYNLHVKGLLCFDLITFVEI